MSKRRNAVYAMSRRRLAFITILCIISAVIFAFFDHSYVSPRWKSNPKTGAELKSIDFEKYNGKEFTVVKVIDGDTIDIDVPDYKSNHTRIRLWGVDTPETKSPEFGVCYFGSEASNFTKKLTLGKRVFIYLNKADTRDKYDRLLAYVQLPDKRFLNEVLLEQGFAYADLRFRHSFYNKYKQLGAAARSAKKGLWQNVNRDQLPEWLQSERPTLLLKK